MVSRSYAEQLLGTEQLLHKKYLSTEIIDYFKKKGELKPHTYICRAQTLENSGYILYSSNKSGFVKH